MTPDTCVIVPTIREHECVREYVANARKYGHTDRLFFCLVTEEFCDVSAMRHMLNDLNVAGAVFDGSDRSAWYAAHGISQYEHLVPEASHAETSFGLLYLWANQFEFGMFIDDDTLPHDADFFGTHYANLARKGRVTTARSDKQWVNVLHQNFDEHGLYPRGYPYSAMDESVQTTATTVSTGDVVASQGLWTNVPDLDAVRILMDGNLQGQAETRTSPEDFGDTFATAPGQYLTVCSMNLAFRREIVPAFYQLPMDDNEWNVGRFDDIWSGVFLKRATDLLGDTILTGYPLCQHNKAARPTFDDLQNEVPALELNEHIWELVDYVGDGASTYQQAFSDMADTMAHGQFEEWANGAFLNYIGEYMQDWLDCLATLEEPPTPSPTAKADDD